LNKFQTMLYIKIKKGETVKCDGIRFVPDNMKCKRIIKGPNTMFIIFPATRSDDSIDRILCKKCAAEEKPKFVKKVLEI